jgi:hypothetical protein
MDNIGEELLILMLEREQQSESFTKPQGFRFDYPWFQFGRVSLPFSLKNK